MISAPKTATGVSAGVRPIFAEESPVLPRSFPSHWTVKFDPPSGPVTLELEVNQVGLGTFNGSTRLHIIAVVYRLGLLPGVIEGKVYHWKIFVGMLVKHHPVCKWV